MIKNILVWSSSRVLFHNNKIVHKGNIIFTVFGFKLTDYLSWTNLALLVLRKTTVRKINLFSQSVSIVRRIWPTWKVLFWLMVFLQEKICNECVKSVCYVRNGNVIAIPSSVLMSHLVLMSYLILISGWVFFSLRSSHIGFYFVHHCKIERFISTIRFHCEFIVLQKLIVNPYLRLLGSTIIWKQKHRKCFCTFQIVNIDTTEHFISTDLTPTLFLAPAGAVA